MLRTTFRFLFKYAGPWRWHFLLGLAAVLLAVQANAFVPRVVQVALDHLGTGFADEGFLISAAVVIVLISLIGMGGMFLMRRILVGASRGVEYDIRRDFFAHLETLSFRVYAGQRTGDLMSRATADIEGVRMLCGPAIMHFSFTAMLTPTVIAWMVTISPWLTVVSFIPFVLVSILVRIIAGRMFRLSLEAQAKLAEVSNKGQENFAGIRVVKAFSQEAAETESFGGASAESRNANLRLGALRGFFQGAIFTLANLGVLMFIVFSPDSIGAGELTFAQAIAFFAWQEMLIWPMIAFGWTMALFQRGMASVQRLQTIFDLQTDIAGPDGTHGPPVEPDRQIEGALEFRDVTFRWKDDLEPVLDKVSFSVPAGGTVAFLGPIGAGKTTIARMIPRLIDPSAGQVLIDGIDARRWPVRKLREAVGYAPQDSFLFSETIAYNIGFAIDDAGRQLEPERAAEVRAQIERAGRMAALDSDIASFQHGYDQVIGERGVTLSGGQKQRVALARALLAEPRILVLDDSFSAVDTDTEERILAGLKEVIGRCTTILIAHRVSTVRHADRIFVLQRGQITEQGTDAELMELGGFYADMATRQRLQAEVDAL